MPKQLTTEEFIVKAKAFHGDIYGYDEVTYLNNRTKIKILCPRHGIFYQTPNSHLNGNGCFECYKLRAGDPHRLNKLLFIEKARKVHNDKYSYENVVYKNNSTKIKINCLKHGQFIQRPSCHLKGKGCRLCKIDSLRQKFSFTKEQFIEKANELHYGLYDYSNVDYVNSHTKVTIRCKKHGDFRQKPIKHLSGQGCSICKSSKGELVLISIFKKNNIDFVPQFKLPETDSLFRYDFYLPKYNTLVEFHGIQHFKPVAFFGGEENLSVTKFRDTIKKDLARETNRSLVEIIYKDLDLPISDLENKLLKKLTLIKETK